MPSFLQIEHISKSYGPKILFENISFNVNEGDKIALIAPNGTGKTTLMRILSGKDHSDSGGKVLFLKDIRIAFLEQDYSFDPRKGIMEQILSCSAEFTNHLDPEQMEEYKLRITKHLTDLGLSDFGKPMGALSGGEVKRVAITQLLASEPDFLILDEPTNHLDIDAIEYLEDILGHSRRTLLMVTHDRYFLDRVCNIVMELDHGSIYTYRGDYENYLEKRQERIDNYNSETDKVRNLLRRELEWMHATPCARTGKAKYRKENFRRLQERAGAVYKTGTIDLSEVAGSSRLGQKVIDCKHLSFSYGDKCLVRDFSYNFQKGEKIGIVGSNGVGKSTFIGLLTGTAAGGAVSGTIERGETLTIGLYRQDGMHFEEDQTVLETVNDPRLLSRFLFTRDMLNTRIGKLSGGERRRLYLLTILMKQPNLLILDEPTNDLDIVTMDVLEEYLKDYPGTLIMVSHDRHFLDRLADHLLVFAGNGMIKDYVGPFSEYREWVKGQQKTAGKPADKPAAKPASSNAKKSSKPAGLSFNEKRELVQLEKDIEALSVEKSELSDKLNGGILDYRELQEVSIRFGEVGRLMDEKEFRWLELSEKEQ